MRLPQIQISSQTAKIGIETIAGVRTIEQRRAEVRIQTEQPKMEVVNHRPILQIDSSATWDAINGGRPEGFTKRIYSQSAQFVQQHIMTTNEKWRRIGDLAAGGDNPIPDMAFAEMGRERPALPVFGPASRFNTKIEFSVQRPDIEIMPGGIQIDVESNQKPRIDYEPGRVRHYMERYPSVTVTPPPIVDLMA
ncbi:DUF6470 family protein [Paenibacillus mendelii]|uniref:DUF6470 family protein n=1 Tax=Paenibacillus mendelii TaxID=206163 RepID=A0ABV6J3E3_9BACL|nr:DUF6470 family protein [Paenibacillus mendelii]MCQ6563559.1 DUF6470 family protein [Paenibacillus mendelii]